MIHTEHKPSVGIKVLCDGLDMLIAHIGIDGYCKDNILPVTPYILHPVERFLIGAPYQSALICLIVIIGIFPCTMNLHPFESISRSFRKRFIQRVIAGHQIDPAHWASQCVQNIILTDIISALTTVGKIYRTLRRSHFQ